MLTQPRTLKGKSDAFTIEFTLADLFTFLLANGKGATAIQHIELVGGGVPWVLNEYVITALSQQGIQVPPALLQDFTRPPRDFDFRIFLSYANRNDILLVRERIVDFFVQKIDPEQRNLILDTGFSKFTQPKGADLMSTVGFHDVAANCGIDIVLYQYMQRDSLFVLDNLRLAVTPLVQDLQTGISLTPVSSFGNG